MPESEDKKRSFAAALTPPGRDVPAPAPDTGTGSAFVPGAVFAGRYRMITRVGQGGMGEVWRADDLVLNTTVALKLVYSTSTGARSRLLKEVRLARLITHPAVCRVFDVGEADGQAFYSMEFVEGEDLATLVQRAGRLTEERVLDIARQLCDGLAAAHAQGVLHRDLKPANVLVDENGAIRITDFGIAIARTDGKDRTLIGTPGYMAPEQLTKGSELTEQTDIYAVGLILYELLVGDRPFGEGRSIFDAPPRPSEFVPGVDPRLERLILRALAPATKDRPESAAAIAAALPNGPQPRAPRNLLPWFAGAGIAAVIALVAMVSSRFLPARSAALTDQDTIVLADFVNTTGEPVFDGTLKVALAVALEQSPFLKVFPDDSVRDTLQLMERRPDEKVTRALARDIALREQLKALVSGSISSLGTNYVIALEAVNAESGDVMAREQVEASGKEQVLTVLGEATSKLRQKLGESLPSVQRFDVPLARATTTSLEALHAYSLALDDGRVNIRLEAVPHLKRAIELDPTFALAYALLSGIYRNTSQTAEAPPYALKAFELRDRVSERERYFISWRYYLDAQQSWDKALELASSWTMSYPREAFAFNSLGLALSAFGEHERALGAFEQAIRIDPKFVPPTRNLAGSLIALDRYDDARRAIDAAAKVGVSSVGIRQMAFVIGFIKNGVQPLSDSAFQALSPEDQMWQLNSEARAAAFEGRFQDAHDLSERGVQLALQASLRERAGRWTLEDAESHALAGQCVEARREVAVGMTLASDNFSIEHAARALATCGASEAAERVSADLASRYREATLTSRVQRPIIAAAVALGRGNAASARDILEPVKPYDLAPDSEFWPPYLRGQAYLRLGNGPAARDEFQNILRHRGAAPTSPLYPLSQLGLARAATLAGDATGAKAAFAAFQTLWKDADRTLPALAAAREESARLQ